MRRYDPSDWYWQVTADPQVWSSKRFMYVNTSDAAYLSFIAEGGIVTAIDSTDSLADIMEVAAIPAIVTASGLQITSSVDPTLNATYPMDTESVALVGAVARDTACGLGLPRGLSTYVWYDLSANPHTFSSVTIRDLYKAMRDYYADYNFQVGNLVARFAGTLPPQPRVID